MAAARGDGEAHQRARPPLSQDSCGRPSGAAGGRSRHPANGLCGTGGTPPPSSCAPSSGRLVVLDAGTGIRPLGLSLRELPDADRPAAHAPAPRPRRGPRVLRAAVRARPADHDLGPAAGGLVARRADRRLPLAAVLPAPLRRAAVEDRVRRARRGDVAARRADGHLGARHAPGDDARLPARGRRTHVHVHPRQRARARSRTPAPSSPRAPTCSSTTRSTRRTSTAPASAGATRASTTSRRTSTR